MDDKTRLRRAFAFFRPFFEPFLRLKFNYSYDEFPEIDGPFFLLANHNLEMDPILVSVGVKRPLRFVASEHIMRKGFGTWFLLRYFQPIIHQKGQVGISSVKNILRALRDGSSVCLFAEGERSFNGVSGPIQPATGKLARSSGVPLVTYRIEGGYFSQPRWSTTLRRGKLRGHLVHVYSPEELRAMNEKEVNEAIVRDLYEDAYETQKREKVRFKGKKLALGLESSVFMCPECGKLAGLVSDASTLRCSCGWHADYDEFGMLNANDGKSYTVTELDRMQRKKMTAIMSAEGCTDELFRDEVTLYSIGSDHAVRSTERGVLRSFRDRIECCGRVFPFDSLSGMAIYSRNSLVIHLPEGERYEIKSGKTGFCGLKYIYQYRALSSTL